MKPPIRIQPASPPDAATLSELAAVTFIEAYESLCRRSDLDAYIAQNYGVDSFATELADPHSSIWLAFDQSEAVGFLQLVTCSAPREVRGKNPLKLSRLYLRQGVWGGGLGRAFMELALHTATARGHDSLWLSVWDQNPRAMRFYERWGFVDVGWEIFEVGEDRSLDRLLERRIASATSGSSLDSA